MQPHDLIRAQCAQEGEMQPKAVDILVCQFSYFLMIQNSYLHCNQRHVLLLNLFARVLSNLEIPFQAL